jgi:hypothetical protein
MACRLARQDNKASVESAGQTARDVGLTRSEVDKTIGLRFSNGVFWRYAA